MTSRVFSFSSRGSFQCDFTSQAKGEVAKDSKESKEGDSAWQRRKKRRQEAELATVEDDSEEEVATQKVSEEEEEEDKEIDEEEPKKSKKSKDSKTKSKKKSKKDRSCWQWGKSIDIAVGLDRGPGTNGRRMEKPRKRKNEKVKRSPKSPRTATAPVALVSPDLVLAQENGDASEDQEDNFESKRYGSQLTLSLS